MKKNKSKKPSRKGLRIAIYLIVIAALIGGGICMAVIGILNEHCKKSN